MRLPRSILCGLLLCAAPAAAELRQGGKLLLTGGVGALEGGAGGGLATWATIAGNETRDGVGGTAQVSTAALPDFDFRAAGVAFGLFDRVELSAARQSLDTGRAGAALGIGRGFTFDQDVLGVKVKLAGDALYDQDRWLPQVSIGAQYKHSRDGAVVRAVGAARASDTDFYISATKILLAQSLVVSATARLTRANQTGLLGFGAPGHDRRRVQVEASAGRLLTRRLLVGAEYRSKPDKLAFAREDDWIDLFAAYALTPGISVTAAYVDLGSIATFRHQHGAYLSLQARY